jgi:hypothetical protein
MGRAAAAQDRGRAFVVFALGFMLVMAAAMTLATGVAHAAGFTIIDQTTRTTNNGQATSQSGNNVAKGNNSDNAAVGDQVAVSGAAGASSTSVATNSGSTNNTSDGTANIDTGNASSTGTTSSTTTSSSADTSGGPAGFVILDQSNVTDNVGRATAVTGNNDAKGNNSFNTAVGDQLADAGDVGRASQSVATNDGGVTNRSDGRADITTGNATAGGLNATSQANQSATGDAAKNGFAIVDSTSRVNNVGHAAAITGGNDSIGNNSFNRSVADPRAISGATGASGLSSAVNTGTVSNHSDGTSTIDTGNASATGTKAATTTTQVLDLSGGSSNSFAIADQNAPTANLGRALGRSGLNFGAGNNTINTALASRRAFPGNVGDNSRSVADNSGGTTNDSTGTTHVFTGDATSTGTDATTTVKQLAA